VFAVIKSSLVFSLFLTTALNPTQLLAEGSLDYLFALSLEDLLKVKVIGSTLTPKDLKTVPSAVTVFTHKEIKNLGLDSLDELVNLVPGFQSFRTPVSPLEFPIASRGRSISGEGTELLILVDGMRVAQPRNSGSNIPMAKYPLQHIARVEFIRGPGSAVYGSNAMMAVINIITRSDANEVNISYGSFSRRKAHLQASQKIGDAMLDLLANIDMDEGDEYRVPDSFTSNRIVTQDPGQLAHINLKLHWQNTQINLQHNQSSNEDFYQSYNVANGINGRESEFTAISLKQNFDWQAIKSGLWLSYTLVEETFSAQLAGPGVFTGVSSPDSSDAWFVHGKYDDYSETRLLWHNDWELTAHKNVQFGLEYRYIYAPNAIVNSNFDLVDVANANIPFRYYGSSLGASVAQSASSRDIVGLYGQYQHQMFDDTRLTLGLRYDDFSSIGSNLSPRFALVQELNDQHSVKLLYGEAFRAPTEAELNFVNNPVILGNPELVPETVQTIELIWLGQWSDTGMTLGYFENRFKDAIVLDVSSPTLVYANSDDDPSKGVEFEIIHQLNKHWLWRGTYTAIIDASESSFRKTDQLASMMVNVQHTNWNANLIAMYHGDQGMPALNDNGERNSFDGYWVFSGKLQYQFDSQLQTFLQVKNLLDKDYLTPITVDSPAEGTPHRGREILAGMVWLF